MNDEFDFRDLAAQSQQIALRWSRQTTTQGVSVASWTMHTTDATYQSLVNGYVAMADINREIAAAFWPSEQAASKRISEVSK